MLTPWYLIIVIAAYAPRHIHKMNKSCLQEHGFLNQETLLPDFKRWIRGKDVSALCANPPSKEALLLTYTLMT